MTPAQIELAIKAAKILLKILIKLKNEREAREAEGDPDDDDRMLAKLLNRLD